MNVLQTGKSKKDLEIKLLCKGFNFKDFMGKETYAKARKDAMGLATIKGYRTPHIMYLNALDGTEMGDYEMAMKNLTRASKIDLEVNDGVENTHRQSKFLTEISRINFKQKKYKEAE